MSENVASSEQSNSVLELPYTRRVLRRVESELDRATRKFGPIASTHEGYAVILEELDEFWQGVKTKGTPPEDLRDELVQVAAMAVRTILDCLDSRS